MTYFESSSHQSSSVRRHRPSRRAASALLLTAVAALLVASTLFAGSVSARPAASAGTAASPVGAFTTKGAWSFVSAPQLHPPILKADTRKAGLAPGLFLTANLPNEAIRGPMTGEGGPIIYDSKLRPVWALGVGTHVGAADLKQETFLGKPVLAWWEGVVNSRGITTKGELHIVDEHYRPLAHTPLKAQSPWVISLHDASIQGNDIWVTVYRQVPNQNLSKYGGASKAAITDAGVQEYDLTTGKQVGSTWDALKHVSLKNSYQPAPSAKQAKGGAAWDAYHLNSVQALSGGNLLISMRNTWGVYLVNSSTGKILWTLGGKQSNFKFGKGAKFAWQHHAELPQSGTTGIGSSVEMTVFNDDCTEITKVSCQGPSEGMILRLNTVSHSASLVKGYQRHPSINALFLGSMQVLPNGNALVGWGSPYSFFTEFSKSGKELLDVGWPGLAQGFAKDLSYRVLYTQTWVGTPSYPPAGAVRAKNGKTTVYASWNGATQVAKWNVLAGSGAGALKKVATQSRSGFETAIPLSKSYSDYQVQALDSSGHVLGTSKTFT